MSDINYLIEALKIFGIPTLTFYIDKRQEKRKYQINNIDSLIHKIDEIERKAGELYVLSGNDPTSIEKSIIIIISIRQVASMINEVIDEHPKYASDLQRKLIQFRRIITGHQFQETTRKASSLEDNIFTNISSACDELTLILRKIKK